MNVPKTIPEEFLQFVWENGIFHKNDLQTADGRSLKIISTGKRNTDSGPDFFNARIQIDETVWAGNVEIHRKASDWKKHNHHEDKSYDNVILHVVEEFDEQVLRTNGQKVPVFVFQYADQYKMNYRKLLDAQTWIACENYFHKVDPVVLHLGFNRLMVDRLESKTADIVEKLTKNNNNWNETFYQILARAFGFKVNAVPFELLAKAVPLKLLGKHRNSVFQLEAMLFGASGLLNEQLIGDDYFLKLRDEFSFLYNKYKLAPIESHLWKFMRLRPANFPTVRISQLAALVHRSHHLFSQITETASLEELRKLFRVKASGYWNSHFRFNRDTPKHLQRELGDEAINTLIINVVVPFLFVYGEQQNRDHLKNRALEFLEQLPAENNSIIKNWQKLGVEARSAFDSQALLQLKNRFCEKKKCLNCQIGNKLVKTIPEPGI